MVVVTEARVMATTRFFTGFKATPPHEGRDGGCRPPSRCYSGFQGLSLNVWSPSTILHEPDLCFFLEAPSHHEMRNNLFSVLLYPLQGTVIALMVKSSFNIRSLKLMIYRKTVVPPIAQHLKFRGKSLEDDGIMLDFHIVKDSLIFFTTRLCRGVNDGKNSSNAKPSYKYISQKYIGPPLLPRAYIVEREENIPPLEFTDPTIDGIR